MNVCPACHGTVAPCEIGWFSGAKAPDASYRCQRGGCAKLWIVYREPNGPLVIDPSERPGETPMTEWINEKRLGYRMLRPERN